MADREVVAARRGGLRVLKVMPGVSADGGAEQSLLALVPALVNHGVDLHLVVLTPRQGLVAALESHGVVVHDLSTVGGLGRQVLGIRRLVTSLRPDLVHASLFEATLPTQLAMVGSSVPLLVTWANVNYGAERARCRDANRAKIESYRLVEVVTGRLSRSWYQAVTVGVGRQNRSTLHVPADRVLVAGRGRDASSFDAALAQREPTRAALGAEPSDRIVLAVGRQDVQKAYPDLIEQFDEVVVAHPEARLWIAGRAGSDTARIERTLEQVRYGDRVHLLGHRDDVPALLAAADVVACASWREGAAGALIEAMAARRPVVTVRLAGLDGVFVDGVNGLVVDRPGLASGIIRLLDDAELRRRLAEAARTAFDERFTIEAAAVSLLDVYAVVVAGAAGVASSASISADGGLA